MRWEDLRYREKLAAGAAGVTLLLALLYLLLQPMLSQRTRLQTEVVARRAALTWMQNAAGEISRNQETTAGPAATSPLQLIDQTARENHLTGQLKRVEPGTGNEIKVWLENVVFVDLVRWLRQLAGAGQITIAGLAVEKSGTPGRVNARLTFTTGGSTP